jgi:hypothetical protein
MTEKEYNSIENYVEAESDDVDYSSAEHQAQKEKEDRDKR